MYADIFGLFDIVNTVVSFKVSLVNCVLDVFNWCTPSTPTTPSVEIPTPTPTETPYNPSIDGPSPNGDDWDGMGEI